MPSRRWTVRIRIPVLMSPCIDSIPTAPPYHPRASFSRFSMACAAALLGAPMMVTAHMRAAAQAIENLEKDARGWYGGAVGMLSLNGDINTGILIRTVHLRDGIARYGVGA